MFLSRHLAVEEESGTSYALKDMAVAKPISTCAYHDSAIHLGKPATVLSTIVIASPIPLCCCADEG